MNAITLQVPWIVLALVSVFAVVGLIFLLIKCWETIRFLLFLMRGGFLPPEDLPTSEETLSQADKDAQALLQTRIREVWYSFSPVQWLDLNILQTDCHALVRHIAATYFPKSAQPELEVTVLELLQFNERTAHRIRVLLEDFPSFHNLTIASILEAKSLLTKTKQTIDKKSIKSGRRIASRIWTAVNAINPNYWIQRFLFRGASEVIGRKVLTSIYQIVGIEAIQLYHASAEQLSIRTTTLEEALDPNAMFDESPPTSTKSQPSKSEPVPPTPPETEQSDTQTEEPHPQEKEKRMADEQEWIFPDEDEENPKSETNDETEKLSLSIGKMLSAFVEGSLNLWDKMVSVDKVIASFQDNAPSVQCLSDIESLPVETIDPVANAYIHKGRWLTAMEGAATGFGGFLLLSADAVSLLALQLRTIQQIGYCYGFDVSKPEEKLFAAKLLAVAYSHPAGKEKDAIKNEMRMAAGLLKGKTPIGLLQKRLFVQGFSKIAQKIGVRFGSRKAAQLIPIIGSAVGGIVNQQVTKEIANTAKEVYRDRFLERKKK